MFSRCHAQHKVYTFHDQIDRKQTIIIFHAFSEQSYKYFTQAIFIVLKSGLTHLTALMRSGRPKQLRCLESNKICLGYARKITLHCSEKPIVNDKLLLLFAINYSFLAKFLIELKNIYTSFFNFFVFNCGIAFLFKFNSSVLMQI